MGTLGRKNENDYAEYRKRFNTIGSMSITGGNRYSKAVILTTSNVRLDIMVTTIHNIKANSTIV